MSQTWANLVVVVRRHQKCWGLVWVGVVYLCMFQPSVWFRTGMARKRDAGGLGACTATHRLDLLWEHLFAFYKFEKLEASWWTNCSSKSRANKKILRCVLFKDRNTPAGCWVTNIILSLGLNLYAYIYLKTFHQYTSVSHYQHTLKTEMDYQHFAEVDDQIDDGTHYCQWLE
jgi:hypothetical protein